MLPRSDDFRVFFGNASREIVKTLVVSKRVISGFFGDLFGC